MKASLTTQMVKYINNKYPSDEFAYLPDYPVGSGISIPVSSKLLPDRVIWVSFHRNEDGSTIFYDNYLYWKYMDETSEKLISFINNVFGDDFYYEYNTSETLSGKNFTDSMTFEEYFSDKESAVRFIAVLPPTFFLDRDKMENHILSSVGIDNFINFDGTIWFSSDENSYNELKKSTNKDMRLSIFIRKSPNSIVLNFSIRNGKIDKLEWRD